MSEEHTLPPPRPTKKLAKGDVMRSCPLAVGGRKEGTSREIVTEEAHRKRKDHSHTM